jgi:hypothetical protein
MRIDCPGLAGLAVLTTAAVAMLGLAGCGSHAGQAAGTTSRATQCGTTRSAANVPVIIEVVRGQVACSAALAVERNYAAAIRAGKVPGNGGGAPVKLSGWTCQGFDTPKVVKTGEASKCVKGGTEIMAILKLPSSG